MIVVCKKCGKKYEVDPAQVTGEVARFRCESCNEIVTVSRGGDDVEHPATPSPLLEATFTPADEEGRPAPEPGAGVRRMPHVFERRGFGLRGKMFILFFFIPIVLIIAASLLYMWQLNELSSYLAKESAGAATVITENMVAQRARAVASQCRAYLLTHPDLKKHFFNYDMHFKSIAVQQVGLTGYTALYELPDADGVWRTWAHVNPNIIGVDMRTLQKSLGESFPGFWKIYTGVQGGKESKGYYEWRDVDGIIRNKFMVCVPVEGTPYILAATAYPEEFAATVQFMRDRAEKFAFRTRSIVLGILGGTLILIGFIVAMYGYRLTGRVKYLTNVADRISVGDLETEVMGIRSRDEIGELAHAITRMQDSIRISIQRLRRRR